MMNTVQKEKLKLFFRKAAGFFALYAALPLLCAATIGALLFIRFEGEAEAVEVFMAIGEESLLMENEDSTDFFPSFYFLSSEILPPLSEKASSKIGSARYFSSVKVPATEIQEEEKNVPEVLYDSLPAGATPIIKADLSSASYYINTTNYTVDFDQVRKSAFPSGVRSQDQSPLVLVLHTHGTESYFEDNTNLSDFATDGIESFFLQNETVFRTSDPNKSVVQVGKVFSDTLNGLGIPTLHCTVMHDADDFNDAYYNSAETVKKMLAQYPSIQYVIDLHRDSVVRGDSYVKSYTEIEGEASAQVMLVVGTNQNGRHPNWKQNLVVATTFKDTLDSLFPSLSRALYLRTARFNQEFLPGCMLLEVGSAANTLQEAENAARYAAKAFYQMLQNKQ